jgi:hypothetical protein
MIPPLINSIASAETAPLQTNAAPKADKPNNLPTHINFGAFVIDTRYIAPIFITVILLAAQLAFGVLQSYSHTLLAIATSIAVEILLGLLVVGKFPHLASAYISGISVGILVRSTLYWPFALTAAISIASKYAIRWKGRHLWNPSNFGIAMMVLLAHEHMATLMIQWDNRLWAMLIIWALGSFIIWNLKRFHICATYVASFFLFTAIRSAITGDTFLAELAPITGPMYQLFVFFMITDPKTTVRGRTAQCVVAFFVAFAECLIRLSAHFISGQEIFAIHAPYYALFIVGPIANVIDIWWHERSKRSTAPELATA